MTVLDLRMPASRVLYVPLPSTVFYSVLAPYDKHSLRRRFHAIKSLLLPDFTMRNTQGLASQQEYVAY